MHYCWFAFAVAFTLVLVHPLEAQAYVGPGAGMSLIGSFVALMVTVALALGAVLSWPIRRFLKRRKAAAPAPANVPETT